MNKKTEIGKRPQLNLMIMTSLVMLIPASAFISNALHRKADATPVLLSSPFEFPMPAPLIGGTKDLQGKPEAISEQRRQIQRTADGNLVRETYDEKGRRVSKILSTPADTLLNQWDFEPVSGRLTRYEVNEYRGTRLVQRRVARWQYAGEGGFVKTNQIFDSKARPSKSFVESVNAKEIKTKEEWFDEKKRLIAEKQWNPETGDFVSSFMIEYSLGGWSTRTILDEKGKTLSNVLLTPQGRIL